MYFHFVDAPALKVLKLNVSSGPALEVGQVGWGFEQTDLMSLSMAGELD